MGNICSQTKKEMEDELQSSVGMVEAKVATLNSKFGLMDGRLMNIAHLWKNLTTSITT